MTLIEILQALMDGRFHSGVLESDEGIKFELTDHTLLIRPPDQEPSYWDLTELYGRQQQSEIRTGS
jgi:hypothetical protein